MSNLASCRDTKSQAGARAPGSWGLRRLHVSLCIAGATALTACQFDPAGLSGPGGNAGQPDANPSAPDASGPIDSGPGENCGWPFAPVYFDPCSPFVPDDQLPLVLDKVGVYSYDTDDNKLLDPQGNELPQLATTLEQSNDVRAIWVDSLDIQSNSTLRAEGAKPLMIISTGELRVRGGIDVSSVLLSDEVTYDPGAGADPPSNLCEAGTGKNGGDCVNGGGGGGGGGFGGAGARGGRGAGTASCDGVNEGVAGGAGGSTVSPPAILRGGCNGARGGNGDVVMLSGLGGFGGGAVHLVSMVRGDIEGRIHAGGAAGSGAENNRSGGGGGGSGGFIGLEAPDIEIDAGAILAANGGGGGGGCNNGQANPGQNGKLADEVATGGTGQSTGGNGGTGSAGDARAGLPGTDADRGGGGGGGGAGFIVTYHANPSVDGAAVTSPALTQR